MTGCEVGKAWKKSRRQVSTARKCQALSVEVEVCMGELIVDICLDRKAGGKKRKKEKLSWAIGKAFGLTL